MDQAASPNATARPHDQVVLNPIWVGGARHGYLYDVMLDGEIIVSRSHDPEYDAAGPC